jgi:hypothetical protein
MICFPFQFLVLKTHGEILTLFINDIVVIFCKFKWKIIRKDIYLFFILRMEEYLLTRDYDYFTTRKQAISGGQGPSLTAQSRRYQGNYWRPKGMRKTSVGKCIDGLGRRKWKGQILWRPGSPVPSNGQNRTHWLATAWAVSNFALVTAQAVTKD